MEKSSGTSCTTMPVQEQPTLKAKSDELLNKLFYLINGLEAIEYRLYGGDGEKKGDNVSTFSIDDSINTSLDVAEACIKEAEVILKRL